MYHAKTAIAIRSLLFLACGSRSGKPNFLVFPEIVRLSEVWIEKCCRAEYQYFGFLLGQFEAANLSVFNNNWSSVFDFTPAAGETTWILLPEVCERTFVALISASESTLKLQQRAKYTCAREIGRSRNARRAPKVTCSPKFAFARVVCPLIEISDYLLRGQLRLRVCRASVSRP